MNARNELEYRLELAAGYLREAETDYAEGKWHGCLANAQESAENAGKAIISCLAPVPKTHDVVRQLAELLGSDDAPDNLRAELKAMLPDFAQMGLETHIRVTYGDEESFTPPWALIGQSEAETGLERSRRALALGRKFQAYFSPPPEIK